MGSLFQTSFSFEFRCYSLCSRCFLVNI